MAKPATTHVIEIESGIGEPAFIPLTLGQELQPISVGKKGMWRVEGARVLDVHAFVYFDGNALFLQSADEGSAALVDGYRVGKAWTELHAPCRIEVGAARLRFRSLMGDPAQAATVAAAAPPMSAPPGGPGGHGGGAPPPRAAPPPAAGRPAAGRPAPAPAPAPSEPMSFPKPERPFAPGALSSQNDDESTRIAPVAPTGMSGSINAINAPPREPPRPAAGRPVEEDLSTRPEAARAASPATGQGPAAVQGSGGYPAQPPPLGLPPGMVQGVMPLQGMPPGGLAQSGMQPGMQQQGMPMQGMPSGSMPPGMPPAGGYGYPPQPGGYPPQQQQGYPQQQQGGGNQQSGAYGAMPSGGMQAGPGGPSMAPGGYGAPPTNPGEKPPNEGLQSFADVMKDPAQRKKLIAIAIILLGGVYLLLLDDEPAPTKKRVVAKSDAGVVMDGGRAVASSTAPIVPQAPCPPGFQAYGEVRAGQPVTCVPMPTNDPIGVGTQADAGASNSSSGGPLVFGPTDAGADSGRPKSTSTQQKTLERQAVDYVALGEYNKAIGIYEQLARQFPDNKVYSEALRILRQKLDAGVQ